MFSQPCPPDIAPILRSEYQPRRVVRKSSCHKCCYRSALESGDGGTLLGRLEIDGVHKLMLFTRWVVDGSHRIVGAIVLIGSGVLRLVSAKNMPEKTKFKDVEAKYILVGGIY